MSSISRSVNLLARSSRASLLRPRAVNPVHHVFASDKMAVRGLATAFERTKPHVNIGMSIESRALISCPLTSIKGTIGHVDHGKVRLDRDNAPPTSVSNVSAVDHPHCRDHQAPGL